MPPPLQPPTIGWCSASSRSFLLGPDGPCGGSTWTSPALRRSHRARRTGRRNKIRITKSPRFEGNPDVARGWFLSGATVCSRGVSVCGWLY
jgi:hypothetical protein